MKNLLIILFCIFFITCESSTVGVDENQGISYYDCLAFGWQAFFDKEYELALDYFNTAYVATDEEFHNSAHIAIGWTYLFMSNEEIGNEELVVELRSDAYNEFTYVNNEIDAIESYSLKCPYVEFCCSDCFYQDRKLGKLISDIEFYFYSENQQNENDICISLDEFSECTDGLIFELKDFIVDNDDFDFMNGKPDGSDGDSVNMNIDDVVIYLAQNYLRINKYQQACEELFDADLACGIQDCGNFNISVLLNCIQGDFPF